MNSHRRAFLGSALSIGGVALAGCLTAARNGIGTDRTTGGTPNRSTGGTATPPVEGFEIGDPDADEQAGDAVLPHEVAIENEGATTRRIEFGIVDTARDEVLLSRSHPLSGGETIAGGIVESGTYELRVRFPAQETQASIGIKPACDVVETRVRINPDGRLVPSVLTYPVVCESGTVDPPETPRGTAPDGTDATRTETRTAPDPD
jgi:hypothetical protein